MSTVVFFVIVLPIIAAYGMKFFFCNIESNNESTGNFGNVNQGNFGNVNQRNF